MATDYFINPNDTGLMQTVYQQDVDLGFDWAHIGSAMKQAKDMEESYQDKNEILNVNTDFCVDGETGEQVPVNGKPISPQISNNMLNQYASNQQYDGDDGFEYFDPSAETTRPQKLTQVDNRWQPTSKYSELTVLNGGRNNLRVTSHSNSMPNLHQNFSNPYTPPYTPDSLGSNPHLNTFNPTTFSCGELSCTSSPMVDRGVANSYCQSPHVSPANYSPSIHNSPKVIPQHLSPDESAPMDIGYSSMSSPEKKEFKFPSNQFNQCKYNVASIQSPSCLGERNPPVASLPEPGQGFFDLGSKPELPEFFSEFTPINNSISSFQPNMAPSYLNHPVGSYPPPPLSSSPPFPPTFLGDQPNFRLRQNGMTERCGSDSGISVDYSPKGFSYATNGKEKVFVNSRDFPSSNHGLPFQLEEIKPFQIGNNFSNNIGTKKQTKKKNDKSSTHSRESRDERKARELNLPFTLEEIIMTPVEDYNEMLARTHLSAAQQALVKDIRRRGKNKVAAQNCRKRKIETITNMEEDVDLLRIQKQRLVDEQRELESRHHGIKLQYHSLHQEIFNSLRDEAGQPYDPSQFCLEQVDGTIMVVPRPGASPEQRMSSKSINSIFDFAKIKLESEI